MLHGAAIARPISSTSLYSLTPRAPFAPQFCRGRAGFEAHTHMAAPHFGPWQAFVDSQPFTALVELLSRLKSPS